LNFSYEIYPELEIYSGIGIVNFEEQILKKQIVYHYDSLLTYPPYIVNISSTYFHINGDSTGSIKNKITYLEIPAGIHYYIFHGKKFSISLQPEISFNRIIRSEIYTVDSIKREYSKNNAFLRSWTVSYGAGLGFHYSIRDNMSIGLTPFFRNFQKSIFLPSCPVSQKVQQVELRISVKYFL
jgi:opacity protein-like surface antigen